ncbi:sugar ABC transporter permease [Clostridium sp. AF19-22AC]|jgi:raffinose/stachyose/melibiose transport system permease protein|uniref:Carbohydrate ABC transporter membrane protein 1 (CUT1 family) n=1 Tax=Faecalicatena orotica TaxID=1544 RepID=A0A2Y9C4X9_9FIRM|nr:MULTISPECIES: sugar ABC transporter permease [Clostridia]PWJ30304.1 carbohydrate ABC transporter membrane protein 1 (CUT1 family) [Faecalicatena orotica]RHR21476.1 sugar ABC transporter permease [Clostridium sp. AF19-22AC]SSA55293.1 carbohydrate ABC transporter membrane protein 1, CUT1 family [Faecalicatena orotica]
MESNIYRNKKPLFVFLIPAFIFMVIFLYYPFVKNILNSFQNISSLGAASKGWNDPWYTNYVKMFNDPNMRTAILNTIIMMLVTIVGQVGIAVALALMVDNIKKGAKFFRTVFFFPIVISATALGLMFNLIFLYDKGMVNQLLEFLGKGTLTDWKDTAHALVIMLLPVMWQYVGFYFVILITGLNNIPEELYESASIDGATRWQRIRYITLPMLRNVICTCVVLAVTGALKVFDLPWVMFPKGMPLGKTWLTGTYMYYQAFNTKNVDYSSAIAVVIVVLGIVTSKIVNKVFKEADY